MAETAARPYATHLDIKFDPLTLIDVSSLEKTVTDRWYNQTLCKVNDSVVRLGVMQGEYHWHKHDSDDEFFFVLSGRFIIDLEGHSIELLPNQGFTVPRGVLHRTRAPERSVNFDGRDRRDPANGRCLMRLINRKAASAAHAGSGDSYKPDRERHSDHSTGARSLEHRDNRSLEPRRYPANRSHKEPAEPGGLPEARNFRNRSRPDRRSGQQHRRPMLVTM